MTSSENAASDTIGRKSLKRAQVDLLALAEGFFESQILFALCKLDVFNLLGTSEKSIEEIASRLDARPESLSRLLNGGVVLNLLESEDGRIYRVNPVWWPVLLESFGDSYLGNWLKLLDYLASSLTHLDKAAVEGGPTVDLLKSKNHHDIREFTLAMHNYAAVRGKELAHFLDTTDCTTLLDLGAGPGTYAFQLGMNHPDLQLFLLDLPEVLEVAREIGDRYQLDNAVTYLPIDVTREEVPGSYDLVLVSNTLHMLGEMESRKLLKRLYDSVKVGGSLVVQFQCLDDDRLGGRWPIILDLVQLCITQRGRNHTVSETREWMQDAGYEDIEFCAMSLTNTNRYMRGYKRQSA